MEDLFNPTEEPVVAPIEDLAEVLTEVPIEDLAEVLTEVPSEEPVVAPTKDPYTTASYRRCFKRPPKPRFHAEAVSPGDAIKACTVRPNERLSVLSSLNIQQEENMEPLPEFSRDMRHANRRYQKAVKDAQDEAERAKKEQKGNN